MSFIPKHDFSFDDFIEKALEKENISVFLLRKLCLKEIDRVNNISRNRLTTDEFQSSVYYMDMLRGLVPYLLHHHNLNDDLKEKKYRRIEEILSQKTK